MSIQREVERIEDMSPRGRLRLLQQADGDIIVVAQHMEDGLVQPGGAVEFCTSYGGGGRSPNTFRALIALMDAMEQDNRERPINQPADNHTKGE